jgi:aminopeptidase N
VLHDAIEFIKKAVRLFEKYAFQNVTTENFFDEVRNLDYDLDRFRKEVESSEFNNYTANVLLNKNKMKLLFEVEKLKKKHG